MSQCACPGFLTSTVGKKFIVALTSLLWVVFVFVHMSGNFLIFKGAEAYNRYSYALTSNPFIYAIEFLLVALLLTHAFVALSLKFRNWRANPKGYAVRPSAEKSSSFSSRTMAYTGPMILAFLIWHLATFKYGPTYTVTYDGLEMRDLFRLVSEKFQSSVYVVLYGVSLFFVWLHLQHGVKSLFQTLGINHPRYNSLLKTFSCIYAFVVSVGFLSQPIYIYFVRP